MGSGSESETSTEKESLQFPTSDLSRNVIFFFVWHYSMKRRVRSSRWLCRQVSIVMDQFLRLLHDCSLPLKDVDFLNSDGPTMNHVLVEVRQFSTKNRLLYQSVSCCDCKRRTYCWCALKHSLLYGLFPTGRTQNDIIHRKLEGCGEVGG